MKIDRSQSEGRAEHPGQVEAMYAGPARSLVTDGDRLGIRRLSPHSSLCLGLLCFSSLFPITTVLRGKAALLKNSPWHTFLAAFLFPLYVCVPSDVECARFSLAHWAAAPSPPAAHHSQNSSLSFPLPQGSVR